MSTKESILSRYKKHIREQFDMPSLDDIKGITYPDPLVQFIKMSESVGGQVIEVAEGRDINTLIKELYPDAKEIASNLPEITIATRNPDTIESAQALNGTDVGIIRDEGESRLLHLREPGHPVAEKSDCQQYARGLQAY